MSDQPSLQHPWLVAVWPGMGQVAISAGFYMMAKLGMRQLAEISARDLFDVEHVEVEGGLIRSGHMPRSRLFVWIDPRKKHDIVLFIGEAQPPAGKYAFCQKLVEYANLLGVERVFTFAAMATPMHPRDASRVFGAAIDQEQLAELRQMEVEIIEDGQIGGLNGVLLGAAAERGLRGACLLGEMPHVFAQLPWPKASLAVLKVFTMIADIEIDTAELFEQSKTVEEHLSELLTQVEEALEQQSSAEEDDESAEFAAPAEEDQLSAEGEQRIEQLFAAARQDRSKAYELKRQLDELEVFEQYEDRFLDLFKNER